MSDVPPEVEKLREQSRPVRLYSPDSPRIVTLSDAEAAVRACQTRMIEQQETNRRALREIERALRDSGVVSLRSAIAAILANGPLDDAPGGPCEQAVEAARLDERERLSARAYENGWCPTCGKKAVVT